MGKYLISSVIKYHTLYIYMPRSGNFGSCTPLYLHLGSLWVPLPTSIQVYYWYSCLGYATAHCFLWPVIFLPVAKINFRWNWHSMVRLSETFMHSIEMNKNDKKLWCCIETVQWFTQAVVMNLQTRVGLTQFLNDTESCRVCNNWASC